MCNVICWTTQEEDPLDNDIVIGVVMLMLTISTFVAMMLCPAIRGNQADLVHGTAHMTWLPLATVITIQIICLILTSDTTGSQPSYTTQHTSMGHIYSRYT